MGLQVQGSNRAKRDRNGTETGVREGLKFEARVSKSDQGVKGWVCQGRLWSSCLNPRECIEPISAKPKIMLFCNLKAKEALQKKTNAGNGIRVAYM